MKLEKIELLFGHVLLWLDLGHSFQASNLSNHY
jgi:hypothetical protein